MQLQRTIIRVAAILPILLCSHCFQAESKKCSWGGVCPPDMVCFEETRECVFPSQLRDCLGKDDGEPCEVVGQETGYLCLDEVCLRSRCGDGWVDDSSAVGEACDDGNTEAGDGCRADCLGVETCPDGLVDEAAGEECDDGNTENSDGCTNICHPPFCGDGFSTGGEQCDHGAENSDTEPNACRTTCRNPACGDQVQDAGERSRCWLLQAAGRQDTGSQPLSLTTGDLDGDGLADVAVAAHDASQVAVFLSDGLGGLVPAAGSPLGVAGPPTSVALGDVDGDDATDLVVATRTGGIHWFAGDGVGGLSTGGSGQVAARFTALITVPLDDVAGKEIVATDDASHAVWVFHLDGTTPVVAAMHSAGAPGYGPVALTAADLNGDGHPEIAVANRDYAQISLFTSNPGGALSMAPGFPFSVSADWSSSTTDVAVADTDGDGHLDLVWLDARAWSQSHVGVLLGDGQLGFEPVEHGLVEVGPGVVHMASADIDSDGWVDLALPSMRSTEVAFLFGYGDGGVWPDINRTVTLQASGQAVGLADFNGDGHPDLVLADQYRGYVDLYLYNP